MASLTAYGQAQGVYLQGQVLEASTQEPVQGAAISLQGLQQGGVTDSSGHYSIAGLPRGTYAVQVDALGYEGQVQYEIRVETGVTTLNFNLQVQGVQQQGVTVTASSYTKSPVNIISLKTIGAEQIRTNPGGNFDISKVVQSLPGVAGSVGVRNDISVRGGAPNENVYYLDGIEVPSINHFSTQGSGGGPQGIISSTLIQKVTLQSSNFGARFDNTLSSVLDFELLTPNTERFQTQVLVSATEAGVTFDTPLDKKGKFTALVSNRVSYLQYLFKVLQLPILPSYWDNIAKVQWQINDRTTLTYLSIAAIDRFRKNNPTDVSVDQRYVLDGIPIQNQNTTTQGLSLKHLTGRGYYTLALSRDYLHNTLSLYSTLHPGLQVQDYSSTQTGTKLRLNVVDELLGFRLGYGGVVQYNSYTNRTFDLTGPVDTNRVSSGINLWQYGAYASLSRTYLSGRLITSAGLRVDANSFTTKGNHLGNALGPRAAFSLRFAPRFTFNASVGSFTKLPPLTLLGYGSQGNYLNKNTAYIRTTHWVAGVEYQASASSIFSVEAFIKDYSNYPVSLLHGSSLANNGGFFGVFGNEATQSYGAGRSYGVEFFAQKKLTERLYGTASYTLFNSQFAGADGKNIRSAWDNRQLLSLTGGIRMGKKKQYELSGKWRYLGGFPYTPYRLDAAAAQYYAVRGQGVLDYSQLNRQTSLPVSQVDVRLERKWFLQRMNISLFVDVQNVFNRNNTLQPDYTLKRDAQGNFLQDAMGNYEPTLLTNTVTSLLPSLGVLVRM